MRQSNDRNMLSGERSLSDELRDSHKAMSDLWQGVTTFSNIKNCVTFYGSARFGEDNKFYQLARETAGLLAASGFTIMTGGGPGIMEAANRGAKEGGGLSLGCNIKLPHEQKLNPYVDLQVEFEFFFTRKVILRKNSIAYVLLPGGFGTMDEIFEVLTLIQTGRLPLRPVVCMGTEYWKHMRSFLRETMVENGTISPTDLELALVTDDPEAVVSYIRERTSPPMYVEKEHDDIY